MDTWSEVDRKRGTVNIYMYAWGKQVNKPWYIYYDTVYH